MRDGARRLAAALGAAAGLGASAASAAQPYQIGGGDTLQVGVWKNPELSQTVVVRPDGMITLPLVKDIPAADRTAVELGTAIEDKFSAFVNAPNVTVTVVTATNYRVYTHGAVTNGMFSLASPINALQLLARAGGPAGDADLAAAFILRGAKRIFVDLQPRAGAGADGGAFPELVPEDVLVVPFRDAARRVLVAGEVQTPVSLPFKDGMTVLDAFVAAGGGTEYADLGSVRVVHAAGGDRNAAEVEVDLSKMLEHGDLKRNFGLAPGDIVVVPR